ERSISIRLTSDGSAATSCERNHSRLALANCSIWLTIKVPSRQTIFTSALLVHEHVFPDHLELLFVARIALDDTAKPTVRLQRTGLTQRAQQKGVRNPG